MELYMLNRQNGQMILESVESGPLIWPSIVENGVTRPKKYSELSATEALKVDCDIKETDIILQGLQPEVYALVSNRKVAKELWERIQLLMQGTSLTKQERECKIYDEFDKFAYKKGESLGQHEFHENEVRLMHERNSDPLALVETHQMTQSPYQTHQNSYKNTQFQPQVSSYQSPQYGSPYQSQQYSTHQSSTPLSIFYPSNEYQSSIYHNIYSPLSSIPHLEYAPSVDQQSEFSQQESGRQTSVAAGTSRTYTPEASGNNYGKPRMVICYNCKGEGHMSKQCTKPKRKRMIRGLRIKCCWFKLKQVVKFYMRRNSHFWQIQEFQKAMPSSEQSNVVNHSETEITSDSNIIPYSQYLIESQHVAVQNSNSSAQQDDLILSVIEQLKTQVVHCTKMNLENKSVNDTLTAELERYKEQVKVLKEGQNVDLKSQDNVSDSCAQSVEIDHLKRTLSEHLKEKESLLQTVTLLKNDFKQEESRNFDREIALEKRIKHLDNIVFKRDQSAQTVHMLTKPQFFYDNTTKQALGTFNQQLVDELAEVQNVFYQMEQAVKQHRVESKTFEVKMNQALNENERLLEQVMSKDIVNLIVNSSMDFASVNVHECEKCLKLETELQKDFVEKEIYDKLFKSAPSFDQLFELNKLKAQSQEKDMVIKKLKERIKSLSGNMDKDKIKQDLEEIETINIELDHRVTKLIAKNEHLKQTYKQLYGHSIKPARVRSKS
ncbi:retrovirus-related pol polyprotein from transposon TNT 1-94 [Tanacetum coccineum]